MRKWESQTRKRASVPQHVAHMEHVTRPRVRLGDDAQTNPQLKVIQHLEMLRQRSWQTDNLSYHLFCTEYRKHDA